MKIGPAALWLQDFLTSGFIYSCWEWKLDTFLVDESSGKARNHITVRAAVDEGDEGDSGSGSASADSQMYSFIHRNTQESSIIHGYTQESSFIHGNIQESSISPGNIQESSISPRNKQESSFSPGNIQESSFEHRNIQESSIKPRDTQESSISPRNTQKDLPGDSLQLLDSVTSGFHDHQILKTRDGYLFRYFRRAKDASAITYHVNREWNEITLLEDHTESERQFPFEYLSFILPHVFLRQYQVITFHGVLMEYEGAGIIISANSGVGKTTHARLWKKVKNSFIINGDKSACYKKDGVWTGFGTPWCGTSGEYMNREVPIRAIVLLERGQENQAQKLGAFDGFRRILNHALYPRWDEEMTNEAMDLLDDLVGEVPVYRLQCRPNEESVEVLYRTIFAD